MTVYYREKDEVRMEVNEDQYLMDSILFGKRCRIMVNSHDVCVYRVPGTHRKEERLHYGGRGRGYKSPVDYGGW